MNRGDSIKSLLNCFQSGQLVSPSADHLNFVDLVRALARLAGADDVPTGPGVKTLCRKIGPADHYVFVLIDGLGMNLIRQLATDGFFRSHLTAELRSVFLSTTATALTSLATAQWPAVHSVPGWWMYFPDHNVSAVTLPFVERSTGRSLAELGITPQMAYPVPSIWPEIKHELLSVVPVRIKSGVYNTYATGNTPRAGYTELPDALAIVRERVLSARRPSFTYLYLPQLDALCHARGIDHPLVPALLASLDQQFSALAADLAGRARLVISSDHGQVNVSDNRRIVLPENDPLCRHVVCPPTGEPTVPIFHVRDGHEASFASEFTQLFGDLFVLLTPDEVEQLRLLGPENLSPTMKCRLGTFVGIALQPAKFYIRPCDGSEANIGVHGGLSPDEMSVPLITV